MKKFLTYISIYITVCSHSVFGQDDSEIIVFPEAYINSKRNTKQFTTSETFELANILLVLSKWGQNEGARNYFRDTEYYRKVANYIQQFNDHQVFDALAETNFNNFNNLVGFRDNAILFHFDGDKLIESDFLTSWWNSR